MMDERLQSRVTRYCSFGKFVSFLDSGLFLANAQSFEDPWEGHVFHSLTAQPKNIESLAAFVSDRKQFMYVTCWHAAEHESYAMWRIYGRDDAVAIHTNGEKLKSLMATISELHGSKPLLLTPIEYVMPSKGRLPKYEPNATYSVSFEDKSNPEHKLWRNAMQQLLGLKPSPYEYEKEVRLIALDADAPRFLEFSEGYVPKAGISVPIKLDSFISEVTVAPWANAAFVNAVVAVSEKFGLTPEKVKQSRLFASPEKR